LVEKNIIKWSPEAKMELKEIYSYLKKRSLQGANHVKKAILKTVDKLENSIAAYPFDPFLGEPYRYIVTDKYKQDI
jgi:plasmid stabilization system protein ParE